MDIDPFDPAVRGRLSAAAVSRLRQVRMAAVFPDRYAGADLADVRRQHGDDVWRPIALWTDSPAAGLVLLGPTGTGKTHTAAAVAAYIAGRTTIGYWSAAAILHMLRPDGGGRLDDFARVGLLVVDDAGAERMTDWAAEQFTSLVDARWNAELPTIVTSNLSPTDLRDHLGARAWSRLTGTGSLVIRLAGADLRRDPS